MDGAPHDLLLVLVGNHPPETVSAVLHRDVVLHRADGSRTVGRDAVLALFETPDQGVRYRVVNAAGQTLVVAMEVPGVPGSLHLALQGMEAAGVLVEVRVELLTGPPQRPSD